MLGFDAVGRLALGEVPFDDVVPSGVQQTPDFRALSIRKRAAVALIASGAVISPFALTQKEQVTESRWHQPWSEPVRVKQDPRARIALMSSGLFFSPQQQGELVFADKWFKSWAEPKRFKPNIGAPNQTAFFYYPLPIVSFSWTQWLSEPKRFKPGLRPDEQQTLAWSAFTPIKIDWYEPLSEPKRFKPRLLEGRQQFLAFEPRPQINITWFDWLSEPVRKKPRLQEGLHQVVVAPFNPSVSFGWDAWLSEPVRKKPRLIEAAQDFSPLRPFTPDIITLTLFATETNNDEFLAALRSYNAIAITYVSIHEFWADRGAYQSIVEANQNAANVSVEGDSPTSPPASITSVSTIRANVSIVVT